MPETLKLDISQALYFLHQLDKDSRHTIASEAPFGREGLPKWEMGATYEPEQRKYLIQDIIERQQRKSNIYYSVNRPCKVVERQGVYGKNNIDDIIGIRALTFDIDTLEQQEKVLELINEKLNDEFKPSMVIFTGGGYHLIYLLNEVFDVKLYRPSKSDKEKEENDKVIYNRSNITELARDFESMLRGIFPEWKIDNMSNIDRVMRLPGTINYPKLEKLNKGQKVALSRILLENHNRTDIHKLRDQVPRLHEVRQETHQKKTYVPHKKDMTAYEKAKLCCQFICDEHLADSNEWYTLNVMLPLIGAIHAENEHSRITIEEAEELFMLAISGGARYGVMGRGPGYFMRQWKSHRPELERKGMKGLGGLIYAAQQAGYDIPWTLSYSEKEDTERQTRETNAENREKAPISEDISRMLSQFVQYIDPKKFGEFDS
jgi:hypothetical protein